VLNKLSITTGEPGLYELSEQINSFVKKSGIDDGFCVVFTTACDAAVLITSFHDPLGHQDIIEVFRRIFPSRVDYRFAKESAAAADSADEAAADATTHIAAAAAHTAAAHSKSAITGASLNIPVRNGSMLLGHSEGIFLADFIGDRQYDVNVTVVRARVKKSSLVVKIPSKRHRNKIQKDNDTLEQIGG